MRDVLPASGTRRITLDDFHAALAESGPTTAESIGSQLFPDVTGGSAKGGPSNAAYKASQILGRLLKQGRVTKRIQTNGGPSIWTAIRHPL